MRYTIYINCFALVLLFSIPCLAQQQQPLTGKIRKKGTREVLQSVSIHNQTRQRYNLSDVGGNFKITAGAGDTLVFSSAGYKADTLVVSPDMFGVEYQVYLEPRVVDLPTVRVGSLTNYQLDSIERRKTYDWVYGKKGAPFVDKNRQGDGIGATFNLPSFSSADRQRERLKKRLIQEEEDYYIDSRFSREFVFRLTKLEGDSLQKFMYRYRPTYLYTRLASNQDLLLWINDSFIKFKKGE